MRDRHLTTPEQPQLNRFVPNKWFRMYLASAPAVRVGPAIYASGWQEGVREACKQGYRVVLVEEPDRLLVEEESGT
jgi:hypothetical protein